MYNQGKENWLIIQQTSQVEPREEKQNQTGVPNQVENRNFTVLLIN